MYFDVLMALKLLRIAAWVGLIAATLVLSFFLYSCASARAVRREITKTPRDSATGVALGAEALTFDPPPQHFPNKPTTACLLVHGFIGSPRDFADLGQRLANMGMHVRVTRLPGHGTTPADFACQTPETMYNHVVGEFRDLKKNYQAVNVIGFSMGGTLATLLAAREDVNRLVLVAPYFGVTSRWFYVLPPETWHEKLGCRIPYLIKSERFVQLNRREAAKEIFSYHCVPSRGVTTLLELGRAANRPEILRRVQCPALMVATKGDLAACPVAAEKAFRQIGSARKREHWLNPRSNHQIFWDYEAEDARQVIVSFITDTIADQRRQTGSPAPVL